MTNDRSAYLLEWQRKNKDKVAAACKRWQDKNKNDETRKQKAREASRKWYAANKERAQKFGREYYLKVGKAKRTPERRFKESLKRNYGLSVEEYNQMVAATGGFCPICSDALKGRNIHVDHCHKTGRVRGILCSGCNWAEGYIRTSANAYRLYEYMKRHEMAESL